MPRRRTSQEILQALQAEDDGLPTRRIGLWTLEKLAILLLYFEAFNRACRGATATCYVDGLAGPGMGRIRGAQAPPYFVWGSPLLALRADPPFTQCFFLEKDERNARALQSRVANYRSRAAAEAGDVNADLLPILAKVPARTPCFCLLDPEGTELQWATVRSAAEMPGRLRKPELLILFAPKGLVRFLKTQASAAALYPEKLDALFGNHGWAEIHRDRQRGLLDASAALDSYMALYAEGIRRLKYRFVQTRTIRWRRTLDGKPIEIYRLVFASDHPAGDHIMRDVFTREYLLDFPVRRMWPLFQ